MVFDPVHFLPLLEQKVGGLDQAAPLQGWDLPDAVATLHRLLDAQMGKEGQIGCLECRSVRGSGSLVANTWPKARHAVS
jgi:hypothetical protein